MSTHSAPRWRVLDGDCLKVMPTMDAGSVDAIVCDPPYGLAFMGKHWDHGVPGVEFWREALRVAKPGAYLLAFGGTRTHHRLAVAIEDAGWEIRDSLCWLYAQGFPKSLDVSKAIDKAAGAEREVVGRRTDRAATPKRDMRGGQFVGATVNIDLSAITTPATDAAREWAGWGTGLKPAHEPIIMARKPLAERTVAANVLAHGTGAINVDGCRVATGAGDYDHPGNDLEHTRRGRPDWRMRNRQAPPNPIGRWPANLVLDEHAAAMLDAQSGVLASGAKLTTHNRTAQRLGNGAGYGGGEWAAGETRDYAADTGGASRFFYCAKASRSERNAGLEGMPEGDGRTMSGGRFVSEGRTVPNGGGPRANHHPTVKPIALMRWLCRLVTPPGGLVLDPFMGSGSTGVAALLEGFRFVGIEREPEYAEIARARLAHAEAEQAETGAQLTMPMLSEATP